MNCDFWNKPKREQWHWIQHNEPALAQMLLEAKDMNCTLHKPNGRGVVIRTKPWTLGKKK